MKIASVLLTSLLVSACAGDYSVGPASTSAEIRLRGINAAGYSAVLVELKDLRVTAGDRELEVGVGQTKIDLADPDQGWVLGSVEVPVSAKAIDVSLTLDDFGGYEGVAGAGELDARSVPIRFSAPMSLVDDHGKVTVQLDVRRSLLPVAPERAVLLPVTAATF